MMHRLAVASAGPAGRGSALSLLLQAHDPAADPTEASETLLACERGDIPLDGLLHAESDGRLAGALLYVLQPAQTAFLWPPAVRPTPAVRAETIADALLHEAARRLDAAGVLLAQCLLECDDSVGRAALERNGFAHLADLTYLRRPLHVPLPAPDLGPLEAVAFDPRRNRERFLRVLDRTYVGTLDCPGLNGVRSARESLDSHRYAADFDPARWKVYCVPSPSRRQTAPPVEDVAVLLMGDHPDQDAWEVLYMGVVPEARGKGYGRAILLDGLHAARERRCRSAVLLAVDDRNVYAKDIYRELGFVEQARRSAHVRLRSPGPRGNPQVVHTA